MGKGVARTQGPRILLSAAVALASVAAAPVARADDDLSDRQRAVVRDVLWGYAVQSLDNEFLAFSQLEGEVVVVNFWASWCRPCQKELPALDELHRDIAPAGGRVVAVSIDRRPEKARAFVNENSLAMPVYHDGPDGLIRILDLERFPFTIVLDRAGNVVHSTSGTDRAAMNALRARVVRALEAPAPVRVAEDGRAPGGDPR